MKKHLADKSLPCERCPKLSELRRALLRTRDIQFFDRMVIKVGNIFSQNTGAANWLRLKSLFNLKAIYYHPKLDLGSLAIQHPGRVDFPKPK